MDTLVKRSRIESFLEKLFGTDLGKKQHGKYVEAMECLNRVEYKIENIGTEFPDRSCYNLPVTKNQWVKLPEEYASGAQHMGIHLGDDYWSVLTYLGRGGYIKPHKHSKEYEVVKVVEGKVRDMVTDNVFKRGDVFTIDKGKIHHLVSEQDECYMYMMFSKCSENLVLPHQETEIAERKVKLFENGHNGQA